MKIHAGFDQGSLEWFLARAGKVTASEMDRLISPLGKVRTGDGPKTFLMEKLAERWLQGPLPSKQGDGIWNLEQGQFLEDYGKPAFTLETGLPITPCAFISTDDGLAGCSPDGLVGENCGLELKCPHLETHVRYLLDGCLPTDYVAQVQGSMYVTGYSHWHFCSFRRNLPIFVLDVARDADYQASLSEAIGEFAERLDDGWKRLCEKNGGPPPVRKQFIPSADKSPLFAGHDPDDVMP